MKTKLFFLSTLLLATIGLSGCSDDDEWGEIERTLNAIDNDRFAHIREQHPDMQEDDIRLCILTRLGISNRTIGNIYCITISAVQHRKLKLKKDVFGESNPDITLEQVINSK